MAEMFSATGKPPVKVLLVEDHRVLREWLGHMITRDRTFTICGEAGDSAHALELIESANPDLLIVDLTLRGSTGFELIKSLKAQGCSIPSLVLSMHNEDLYAERALRAGARGFVSKCDASSILLEAMHHVLNGGIYLQKTARAA